MPVATITVGYPDECPPQVDRLPIEGILHEELYHDYTKEDIDRIYRYKESLPENHQFIKENHKETLAQVLRSELPGTINLKTEVRRGK